MSAEPVSVNLFELLADRMIREIKEAPITADLHLAGGTVTVEIPKKHPWYKELRQRRLEEAERLRTSFKATKLSTSTQLGGSEQ